MSDGFLLFFACCRVTIIQSAQLSNHLDPGADRIMKNNERISQTDALVEKLKRFFLSKKIELGDKLPIEKELCETYHVGRSTLREAIRTLQVMGYVQVRPGSGTYLVARELGGFDSSVVMWIAEHQPDVEEIVTARLAVETLAVRLAAEKGTSKHFTAIEQARLAYEDALAAEEYASLRTLDEEFHKAIFAATGSQLLSTIGSMLAMAYRNWRDRSFRIKKHAANAVMYHQRISAHILDRDAELAQVYMRRHLEQVLIDMTEVLETAGQG